jgi:hypothetical protein
MRLLDRFLGALLGAAAVAIAVIVGVESVLAALDRPPWLVEPRTAADRIGALGWAELTALPVLLVVTLVALGLLVLAFAPRGPRDLALTEPDGVDARIDRRSLQRHLEAALAKDERVADVDATVRRRRATVRVHGIRGDADRQLVRDLRARAREVLATVGADRIRRVRVRAGEARRRVR